MSASDTYLRSRARRRKRTAPPVEEDPTQTPKPGLVSQGGRSAGIPRARQATADDLIRAAAGRSSGPGGWVRIF